MKTASLKTTKQKLKAKKSKHKLIKTFQRLQNEKNLVNEQNEN